MDSGEQLKTLTSPELIGPNDRFGIKKPSARECRRLFLWVCYLLHVVDHLHKLFSEIVGQFHGLSLAVNADDRLSVRLAEMYPTVGEVDLHAVEFLPFWYRGTRDVFFYRLPHRDGAMSFLSATALSSLRVNK